MEQIGFERSALLPDCGDRWWLRGVLFESTAGGAVDAAAEEGIGGAWGLHIEEGLSGGVLLDGLNAAILVEPTASGAWTRSLYIDAEANLLQREVLEQILCGQAGGGFEALAHSAVRRNGTRYVPIAWEEDGERKRIRVQGVVAPAGANAPQAVGAEKADVQLVAPSGWRRAGRVPLPGGSSIPPRVAPLKAAAVAPGAPRPHGRTPLPGGSSVLPRDVVAPAAAAAKASATIGAAPQVLELSTDGSGSLSTHVFWHGNVAGC